MHCSLCEDYETLIGSELYGACKLSDGSPCRPCKQHIDLELEIRAAKQTLDKLLARRQNIRTGINHRHDPIVSKLPQELTAKIFEAYLQFNVDDQDWEIHETPSPLMLGAVCSPWRQIAWTSPQLWSHIRISIPTPEKWNVRPIDVARAWLDRSGNLPLSIYVYLPCHESWPAKDPEGQYFKFIDMINSHSHRFQDLRLHCSPTVLHMFHGNSQGSPQLRKLCLSVFDVEVGPEEEFSIATANTGTKACPSHIQISNIHFRWLSLDWKNLDRVTFYRNTIYLDDCVVLLREAPALRNLVLVDVSDPEDTEDWREDAWPQHPIIHHGLERFRFQGYTGHELGRFFNSFAFPGLKYLELYNITDPSLTTYLISLFKRSPMPHLTNLKVLPPANDDYTTLVELLKAVPFLEHFDIPNSLSIENVMKILELLAHSAVIVDNDDDEIEPFDSFLPNLQSISYSEFMFGESIFDHPLFWLIISHICGPPEEIIHWTPKATGRRPLKHISISCFRSSLTEDSAICTDISTLKHLIDLIAAGVRFEIEDGTVDVIKASMSFHGLAS